MGKKKKTVKNSPRAQGGSRKGTGTALAPRRQAQQEALKAMNPALRKIAFDIRKRLEKLRDQGVITFYEIGKMVAQVAGNRGKYGDHAIDNLAASMPMKNSANVLRYARVFKDVFSVKQVKDATAAAEKKGNEITQSHWIALSQHAGSRAAKTREDVLLLIINEGYTVRDTEKELHRREGRGSRNAPQGRKPAAPKTEMAGLHQISRFHRDISSRVGTYHEHVIDPLEAREGDAVTDELIAQVESTRSDCLDTAKTFTDLAKTLTDTAVKMKKAKKDGRVPTVKRPTSMQRPAKKSNSKPAAPKKKKPTATRREAAKAKAKKATGAVKKKKVAKKKPGRKPVRA